MDSRRQTIPYVFNYLHYIISVQIIACCEPTKKKTLFDILLAELHGDLFSRHASPLEGYVFVMIDDRGEDVLSDEICRRCNGKQQRRRRGGRSVQPPDCIPTFMHACIRTHYVHDQKYSGEKQKRNNPLRSGLGMDM